MDPTLRQPLKPLPSLAGATGMRCLAVAAMLLVMAPLLPGLVLALAPALSAAAWRELWADPQWPQALRATLVSAGLGTALACALAAAVATWHYPGPLWSRLRRRLPLLLALPHAAFAVGLFFLIAPSGWIARGLAWALDWASPPAWVTVQDPWGLSLALALALKESWFLLWILMAVLNEQSTERHLCVARSMGYGRVQAWCRVIWPQLLPRLGWPLAAVLAYSLSVVDMAVVLGPGTPPTLAVLAWRWLMDPDPALQARGAAAALVLLGLLAGLALAGRMAWRLGRRRARYPDGRRTATGRPAGSPGSLGPLLGRWVHLPLFGVGTAVVAVLALWSVAEAWFFPALWPEELGLQAWRQLDWLPFWTTLWLAAAASVLGLFAAVLWLEWGPHSPPALLYLPLVVPALPLVAGQYAVLLHLGLDGHASALVWSHLPWVLPYTVLVLAGPYRAFDPRLLSTARALGLSRWQACWRVKWPLLLRPLLAALAVGFAVSVAQYLPTLFAGGGRFATVTTEAVALSAGGNRQVLAAQALLQVLLPLAVFLVAATLPAWLARQRPGWR